MVPEGYEKLATIGILYRGAYSTDEQYKFLSAVYHSGSTYVALKDNPTGAPTDDGVNWQYMAKGFVEGVLSAVNAQDTSGVLGTVGKTVNSQTLVDAIADKVMTKLLQKNKILQTVEQVMASTNPDNVTGAAATAEINRNLGGNKFLILPTINALFVNGSYKYYFGDYVGGSIASAVFFPTISGTTDYTVTASAINVAQKYININIAKITDGTMPSTNVWINGLLAYK